MNFTDILVFLILVALGVMAVVNIMIDISIYQKREKKTKDSEPLDK